MNFLFVLFIQISSVQYSVSANTLKISGSGTITQSGARSKGTYGEIVEVQIENGPDKIEESTFQDFKNLVKINIPKSVTSIGDFPFFRCNSLKEIQVDEENQYYCSIDNHLYTRNGEKLVFASLNPITFPSTLKSIGPRAFSAGSTFKYENIIFHNAFTTFSMMSFNEVKVGFVGWEDSPQLSQIASSALMYTTFTTFTIPKSCETINEKAFLGSNINQLIFQEESSLKTLKSYSFQEVTTITKIVFPDSLETISDYTFYKVNSLQYIYFGPNVTDISSTAFTGCSNLKEINISEDNEY